MKQKPISIQNAHSFMAQLDMYRSRPLNETLDKAAKDLTHVDIIDIGHSILDEREARFQEEKQRAVAEAQQAVHEKLKHKFEREILRRLEEAKEHHHKEVAGLLDQTEERVQEEISKREAKLQADMSEHLRGLQLQMSQEMEHALQEQNRKHRQELAIELQRTIATKEAETLIKLEEAKNKFEGEKVIIRREVEKVCDERIAAAEAIAETKRLASLADQDKKFQAQLAAVLKDLEETHNAEIRALREEIKKREDYVAKLHMAVDFLRDNRRELTKTTLDVHEQLKFFIDKTQPFSQGNAQFLVPRLDLSRFAAEPDIDPPYETS